MHVGLSQIAFAWGDPRHTTWSTHRSSVTRRELPQDAMVVKGFKPSAITA
jgi:hypothetical protein